MAQELLQRAAQHGDIEEAVLLLEKGHVVPGMAMPPSNSTPVHAACRSGHLDMVNLLLQRQADPNKFETASCGGLTPLHIAAQADFSGIVSALLDGGADPIARDTRGRTPLRVAAQEGQAEVTWLLIAHGADPHMRDFAGFNPAWWAKEFKHQPVLDVYAQMQVVPLKMTATERLAFSGMKIKFAPRKWKKAQGKDGKARSASPSKRKK
ncbi:unnamed protein product [Polarella glacialis]|uniref:Uncharacterized protein n=1 Tax=Polarella glacialis TaxID=89957 RepID=A0A813HWN0_POLGL|nr:unnamed protein product [Polarella glacialis]CAE8722622.1 unnamed protein product [Polarella glacialis]